MKKTVLSDIAGLQSALPHRRLSPSAVLKWVKISREEVMLTCRPGHALYASTRARWCNTR
jgi:hypothetical protein